jgi:ketosteroid isomerase-like protein
MATDTDEIRETLQRFLVAVESLDLGRVSEFFEEDAQMFSPMPAFPKRLDGRAAVLSQFKAIFELVKQQPAPLKLELDDIDVRRFGDLALMTFHLRQAGPTHRRTFVMRKAPSGWRIAHIHASIAASDMQFPR